MLRCRRAVATLALVVLAAVACTDAPRDERRERDLDVYAVVLGEASVCGRGPSAERGSRCPVTCLVVRTETGLDVLSFDWLASAVDDPAALPAWLAEKLPALDAECVRDFARQNAAPGALPPLRADVPVHLLTAERRAALQLSGAPASVSWEPFWRTFPGATGELVLSRVGYDRESRQALVYCESRGGFEGGSGFLLLLMRDADGWRIAHEALVWIA